MSGSAPNRIFNIEWRACLYNAGVCGGDVGFEARLYEGQNKFDFIYGTTVSNSGTGATVGVQQGTGTSTTTFECNTGGLNPGLLVSFSQPPCISPTPTATGPTATPTR